MLREGMTGQDVRALQDALNFHIRRGERLSVDGIFGPKTDARAREFQRANKLAVDGLVGPRTQAELYEVTTLSVPLVFYPNLRLKLPPFGRPPAAGGALGLGSAPAGGLQPPPLIPPLQWPGPPSPPPPPFSFSGSFNLGEGSISLLPDFSSPTSALGLQVTVPTRKDPVDPTVASRQRIIELINSLPFDSSIQVFLISKVPSTQKTISPPPTGFHWGIAPIFNPFDATRIGMKGNAAFSVAVAEGADQKPAVTFGAWGDFKVVLDFAKKEARSGPLLTGSGQLFAGFHGVF